MKIKEVIVSRFAEDDLNEIIDYYYSLSKNYIEKVISEFEKNIMSSKKYPKRGRIVPELEKQGILQYRELIQGYYRIVYEILSDAVIIHTIIDAEEILRISLFQNYPATMKIKYKFTNQLFHNPHSLTNYNHL